MSVDNKLMFMYSVEPVHAGAQKGTGFIDNPIQRESHTHIPMLRGRGVKSALRDVAEQKSIADIDKLFGKKDAPDTAACMRVSDARLLLMPMPSIKNLYAYVTCPYLLQRFLRDSSLTSFTTETLANIELKDNEFYGGDNLTIDEKKSKIILREHVFTKKTDETIKNNLSTIITKIQTAIMRKVGDFWEKKIATDVVVLSDTAFQELVTLYTHVGEGIKIDPDTNTVSDKAMYNTEYLPADALLYTIISADAEFSTSPIYKDGNASMTQFATILPASKTNYIQIGGDYTLYRGDMIAVLQP